MGKSILVMETPNRCIECPCHFAYDNGTVWCGKEDKELLADDIETFKPDWCPLQDAPEKKGGIRGNLPEYDTDNHYEIGWNACIDQILNGG